MKELYSDNISLLTDAINEAYKDNTAFLTQWAKAAKKWVHFANGDQLPKSNYGSGISTNNQPPFRGDPQSPSGYVSSEIEPIMRTLVSYMTRAKPGVEVFPLSKDDNTKNAAKVAEKINDAKYDLDGELENSIKASYWALAVGTVFGKDYWSPMAGSYLAEIDAEGNIVTDPETGSPVYSATKSGSNEVAIIPPFSIMTDFSCTNFRQIPYIEDSYVADVDWAREVYDINAPGYTGAASKIKEENNLSDSMMVLEGLKYNIPYIRSGNREISKGKCLIREMYIAPNREYGRGRLVITAGSETVYVSDAKTGSPYYMELENIEWHPFTMYSYQTFIGRFLGKGIVEPLIPLQTRLNEINKAILVNANKIARPRIMATAKQIPRDSLAGDKDIMRYNFFPGVSNPYILQGAPLPSQFFNERQTIIDQMVRIAGTNFVMQGQQPVNVSAASAIAQLLENSSTQQSASMASWEKFHEQRFTKKIRVIHKFHQFPDNQLNRYVKTLAKDALDTEINDFIGQRDLSDGIVLKIVAGSMTPKSDVAKRDAYKMLAQQGVMGDIGNDPRLRNEFLGKFGLEPFETEESVDIKKAKWENDRIMQGLPVEVSPYDNDPLHLSEHLKQFQDPVFLENATDEQKIKYYDHIQSHENNKKRKEAEAQAGQMPQGGPMPPDRMAPPPVAEANLAPANLPSGAEGAPIQ